MTGEPLNGQTEPATAGQWRLAIPLVPDFSRDVGRSLCLPDYLSEAAVTRTSTMPWMASRTRCARPGGLAHRSAVVIFQSRQQAAHHVTAGHAGLRRAEHEATAPAAHRAGPRARHDLPSHQRLSRDCSFPQTGLITAAALTLPRLRPSLTRVSGQHQAPPAHGSYDLRLRSQGYDLQLP
jgi:hypothetical protein